jgi:hypothetical protein
MKTYLCIDPGANGGWVYSTNHEIAVSGNIDELVDREFALSTTVVIENVPPFTGRLIPSSAAFKLGKSCGWLEGYFQGRGFPVVLVRPQAWQATASVGTKGKQTTTEWKNKLKSEAQRRFPLNTITLKTSDAFLLLSHARQHNL